MNETSREQTIRHMEQLEELTAERDRLRHQNAELLGQLDAVEFAHNVRFAERDRLREALENLLKHEGGNHGWWVEQARAALQESNDE